MSFAKQTKYIDTFLEENNEIKQEILNTICETISSISEDYSFDLNNIPYVKGRPTLTIQSPVVMTIINTCSLTSTYLNMICKSFSSTDNPNKWLLFLLTRLLYDFLNTGKSTNTFRYTLLSELTKHPMHQVIQKSR